MARTQPPLGGRSACPHDECDGSGWVYPEDANWPVPCRCLEEHRRRERVSALLAESGMTRAEVVRWTFDAFDPEWAVADEAGKQELRRVKAQLVAYAAEPRGWVVLFGPYGSGKTALACAVAGEQLCRGRSARVWLVPDLLDEMRATFSRAAGPSLDELMGTAKGTGLLVLDDLGTENATPWAAEKLTQIVDHRWRHEMPMVVTTNVDLYDAGGRMPPRLLSRLLDGTDVPGRGFSQLYSLPCGDYRRRRAVR